MEHHNHRHLHCHKHDQQQSLQLLEQQLQHCQHFCPCAFGQLESNKSLSASVKCESCQGHYMYIPIDDQNQNENDQVQNENEEKEKINKVTMHKIYVDKVTVGAPPGKGNGDDLKLIRNPKKPACCYQLCPTHEQPAGNVPGDNENGTDPFPENLILTDMCKGMPKEIPLELGLLKLGKKVNNQDPNKQSPNVGQTIAPVSSDASNIQEEPSRAAVVIVKPRHKKKKNGSLDMLVVCEGKESKTEEPELQEETEQDQEHQEPPGGSWCYQELPGGSWCYQEPPVVPPVAPKKRCRNHRKKCKTPQPPPECFGNPPPLLCTKSICSIS